MAGMAGATALQHRRTKVYKQDPKGSFPSHSIHFQLHHTTQPTINMFTYTALTLFAVLSQAVMGSPIEKRATNTVIRSGRNGQCLSLPSGVQPANGVQLVTRDCNTATRWDISPGSGSVIVTGTGFALDAGVPEGNNMIAKVWQSYPGSPQQTWFLTADNRIAVTGGNQCLDEGDNGPQTYQCTTGNTNQGMFTSFHEESWLINSLVCRRIFTTTCFVVGLCVGLCFRLCVQVVFCYRISFCFAAIHLWSTDQIREW